MATAIPLKVGVVGILDSVSRYLVQLLMAHPQTDLVYFGSPASVSKRVSQVFPTLAADLVIEAIDLDAIATRCQVVFMNLPVGHAAWYVPTLLDHCQVIDLSADYRFQNLSLYQRCYQIEREDFVTAVNAVYGLPELYHEQLQQARLVGCPGSTPSASLLALAPLLKRGFIEPNSILLDAKQGHEGAHSNLTRLSTHPHAVEIEHIGGDLIGSEIVIQFIPHEVPHPYGLLVTLCANLRDPGLVSEDLLTIYRTVYKAMPWVRVLPAGQRPHPCQGLGTNYCYLGLEVDIRTHRILVFSAIDPHLKGRAGQALQCLNIMQGWEETLGLPQFGYGYG